MPASRRKYLALGSETSKVDVAWVQLSAKYGMVRSMKSRPSGDVLSYRTRKRGLLQYMIHAHFIVLIDFPVQICFLKQIMVCFFCT